MWIRTGLFMGKPKAGQESAFRALVDGQLASALRALPGVHSARMVWPRRIDADVPAIHCQIIMEFDGPDAIDAMMRSDARLKMRAEAGPILAMFDGKLVHMDCEVV